MHFAEDRTTAAFMIQSCTAEAVRINGAAHTSSLLLLPEQPLRPWPVPAGAPLALEHFQDLLDCRPELVVLGTGAVLELPAPEIYGALLECGIGLEAMATAAACRTYNLLAQDGRKVAAALILPA